MSTAAIVIPIYKEDLSPLEEISLIQVRRILHNYKIIFVAPDNVNFPYLNSNDVIIRFDSSYFSSIESYNRLMLSADFYKTFFNFDYILIYQLDAFVFYDALEYFCSLNYDYIGAPWPMMWVYPIGTRKIRVGNGGFCLRKVRACYDVLVRYNFMIKEYLDAKINEDTFFAHCKAYCNFNIAPIDIAYQFSMEFNPRRSIMKNQGHVPFGCHGWYTYDPKFYAQLLLNYNIDVTEVLNQFIDKGNIRINEWFAAVVQHRIALRLKNKQSIIQYLSTTNFDTVYVIGDNNNLVYPLLMDKPDIENIYLYNKKDIQFLDKNKMYLFLTEEYDLQLIQQLQDNGYYYGENFISFFYECMQYYKKKSDILSMKDR